MKNTDYFPELLVESQDLFVECLNHEELEEKFARHIKEACVKGGWNRPRILDIGCGYGLTARKVMDQISDWDEFLLNDISPKMIDQAEKYLGESSGIFISANCIDVLAVDSNSRFDLIYTADTFHNLPKNERSYVIQRIGEVLKPGGIFASLDKVHDNNDQRRLYVAESIAGIAPMITKYDKPEVFQAWVDHYLRDEHPDFMYTTQEQESLLEKHGFTWEHHERVMLEQITIAVKQ